MNVIISSLTLLGSAVAFGSAGYIVDINPDTYEAWNYRFIDHLVFRLSGPTLG